MAQLDEEGESGDIPLGGYAMVLGINVCGDTKGAERRELPLKRFSKIET
jgi:hypothetical protein